MRIDVLTLFPEALEPYFASSIIGRATAAGLVSIHCTDIRDFAGNRHQKVDDRPFGGGPGMVMLCQPVFDAVEQVEALDPAAATRILLTPQGEPFSQKLAQELAGLPRLLMVCGHYEGFDERIREGLRPREISIGDYVLSGGEPAALMILDACIRLLPGVMGAAESGHEESFEQELLEYPQFTRPVEWEGRTIPEVLRSGDHAKIAAWRKQQAEDDTRLRRPDLWERHRGARDQSASGARQEDKDQAQ